MLPLRLPLQALALAATVALGLAGCDVAPTLGTHTSALTLHVPGDSPTIQGALATAQYGDTVQIAAGEYVENLALADGIALVGAGPDQTVLRGSIYLDGSHCKVSGLLIDATGAVGSPSAGIRGESPSAVLSGNRIEDFPVGIRLTGSEFAVITGNFLVRNRIGIELFEAGPVAVTNNVVLNNANAGVRIENGEGLTVAHNTFLGNGFGSTLPIGAAAVVVAVFGGEKVQNNVMVSNRAGINVLGTAGEHHHNLIWGNSTNYAGKAVAGAGDLAVDPLFVNPLKSDYHLKAESPALDVGLPGLATADYDGTPRPQGAGPDLGAFELKVASADVRLIISEVMANPVDENRGEFVELYNVGTSPVDLAGLYLSDGDALDVLVPLSGGPTVVAPGAYAVILDSDYVGGYAVPTGVVTLTVGNTSLGNGLATNDPLTLYASDKVTALASYAFPFDPGNGVSAERVDLAAADLATNWRASPCLQSAGRPNCAPVTLANGLVISEVMANPLDEATGEFVELYNGSDAPIDVAGMTLSDGQATDTLVGWAGGTTVVPALGYAVILDRDWPADQMFRLDPSAVLLTVGDAALGNGLAMSDPVRLLSATGAAVDSYTRTLQVANGRSVEKVSLSMGDAAGNWAQSSCPEGSSPGRLNCVSNATAGPRKPLSITEVMANPLDEDTGEFIELFNRGADPVDAAGLLLSDGDAIDSLTGFAGGTTVVPGGGYALIVDREYAGEYALPTDVVLLTTMDTTLGSGLAIDDPIKLLEANGVEIIDTFRFPFNPGNGVSAERVDLRAFDSPTNWTASTCPSRSSPGANNCAALAAGLPKRVRLTEVMSNQAGTETGGAGEFVELLNAGSLSVDLAGMYLEIGPVGGTVLRDRLVARGTGSTVLPPGGYAVVLDKQYDDRYTFPLGTVLVTLPDDNFGASGLATTHGVALYDADGLTLLDRFVYPSDPGDGISLYRVSLAVVDSAANWKATPCGSTPGATSCAAGDLTTTYGSFWLDANKSEGGIWWSQAIGWPVRATAACGEHLVCTGGTAGYAFRDNLPAPAPFTFKNPYSQYTVVFTERTGPTDACQDPCSNATVSVAPGQTQTVPASSLGYYFAETSGPTLNSLDWFNGDPALYLALPPDGTLAPFSVEVVKP